MSQTECKRDFVRVNDEFNVRIVARDKTTRYGTREINTSLAINISASGMLVNAVERIENGTMVNITFMKPNSFDIFKASGKIVRVHDNKDGTCRLAINFMDLSPDDKQMLDYYIQLGVR